MVRVRKDNIHSGNTELQGGRPRQLRGDVQTSTGHDDSEERGNSSTQGRQGPVLRSTVPDKKRKRQEKKALADGHYGELPNARSAQDIASWYWKEHGLVVIPCKRGEKFPMFEWEYANNIQDIEEVNEWEELKATGWTEISEFNYATVCKPSGVTVIDFDDKEVADKHPVDTLTVETPRGRHYYIRIKDGEVPNSTFPKYNVDIRGNGGIAILPPSLGTNANPYRLASNQQIIKWTLEDFHSYMRSITGDDSPELDGLFRTSNEPGWFGQRFYTVANKGERDSVCTKLAGYLLAANLTVHDVISIMELWGVYNCSPPFAIPEVQKCVESIARREGAGAGKEADDFQEALGRAENSDPSDNPFLDG